jgi:hypothetical protein
MAVPPLRKIFSGCNASHIQVKTKTRVEYDSIIDFLNDPDKTEKVKQE